VGAIASKEERLMHFLHLSNVNELATIAAETGAEVLRGPLRYPSKSGGWQLGDLDLSEHLWQYRDCDVTVTIAATGKAEPERVVCGICGFVMDEVGDCPRCKRFDEAIAGSIRARQEQRTAMLREVEEILRDEEE
jgi:hypothetical protein